VSLAGYIYLAQLKDRSGNINLTNNAFIIMVFVSISYVHNYVSSTLEFSEMVFAIHIFGIVPIILMGFDIIKYIKETVTVMDWIILGFLKGSIPVIIAFITFINFKLLDPDIRLKEKICGSEVEKIGWWVWGAIAWILLIFQYFRWGGDIRGVQVALSLFLVFLMVSYVVYVVAWCKLVENPCPDSEPYSYINRETNQCTRCPDHSLPNSDYDGCGCDPGFTPSGSGCEPCTPGTTSDGGGDALSNHAIEECE